MKLSPIRSLPSCIALPATSFNAPRSVFAVMNLNVSASQWMAALTVGFGRVVSLVRTAVEDGVLAWRDEAKMARFHTSSISTDVVNKIAGRDRADVVFIRPTVGSQASPDALLAAGESETPVSVLVPEGSPKPTVFRLLDVAEESIYGGHFDYGHVPPPTTS